ncbi:MAG: hypothetical protein NC184_03445 [Roseburia sp.]|nr:hypothetical protein [Roseburia sp.]
MTENKTASRRAAIDIGSNSVRLAMSDGTVRSRITKLANGIAETGALAHDGFEATLNALEEYAELCRDANTTVFATEAVRRAANGKEFCAAVKARTDFDVAVLSPEQEARLALFGAVKPQGAVTVCDLGGGSMELISSRDGVRPDYVKSLPLGVVVVKNRFDGDYRAAIDTVPTLVAEYGDVPDYPLVVSGGSACAIAACMLNLPVYDKSAVNGATFSARELDGFMPMLLRRNLALFRPVCAARADTVPYGAIIIQALLNHIGAEKFSVSDSGNLDAVLNGFEF